MPRAEVKVCDYVACLERLIHIKTLEGALGLYFGAARAVAELTGAQHVVVVLPVSPNVLSVVGCWGTPAARLETFPSDRGVIGRAFNTGRVVYVPDVSKEPVYWCYDAQVRSEMAVPLLDPSRSHVRAILNVESYELNFFPPSDAQLLGRLGESVLAQKQHLHAVEELEQERDWLFAVLEQLPDELMVIDTSFRPRYANLVKRKALPSLGQHLEPAHVAQLTEVFRLSAGAECAVKQKCHWLIEGKKDRCALCVCARALRSDRAVAGVAYKPENLDFIVELSAVPLKRPDGQVVGCLETARRVTQREKAIDLTRRLWKCDTEVQLVEAIVEILHEGFGYDRARLYSYEPKTNRLQGIIYGGNHERITQKEFRAFGYCMPDLLARCLGQAEKAGLVLLDVPAKYEQSLGYWQTSFARAELLEAIDPGRKLGLEDVNEIAVVPLFMVPGRLLVMIDSKWKRHGFTYDDLQALTVLSQMTSAALEHIQNNEGRFKLAVLGEAVAGLRHQLNASFPDMQVSTDAFPYLEAAFSLATERFLRSTGRPEDEFLAKAFGALSQRLSEGGAAPLGGDVQDWADDLFEDMRDIWPGAQPQDAQELAKIGPVTETGKDGWLAVLRGQNGDAWIRMMACLEPLVEVLVDYQAISRDIAAFSQTLRTIFPGSAQREPVDMAELAGLAVRTSQARAVRERVAIRLEAEEPLQPVEANRGLFLLTFLALIDNAISAAQGATGGGWVRGHVAHVGSCVEVSLTNNGSVIPVDKRALVFRRAFSTKGTTGLGLLFAYSWVHSDGGDIEYIPDDSAQTTCFLVRLPVAAVASETLGGSTT